MLLIELTAINDGIFQGKEKYRFSVQATFIASAYAKAEGTTAISFDRKVITPGGMVETLTVAEDIAEVTARVNAALRPQF